MMRRADAGRRREHDRSGLRALAPLLGKSRTVIDAVDRRARGQMGRLEFRRMVVANAGLKCFGMDHGNLSLANSDVWYCFDEHTVFSLPRPVGDLARLAPGHIDPTMAYHEHAYLCRGNEVIDIWPIDLRDR
jgi:hypothetical protein